MQVTTYITKPYNNPRQRIVDIPDSPESVLDALEMTFYNGQNEVQQQPAPSLSVGDTIVYEGNVYVILAEGFFCLTTGELIGD